MKKLVQNGLVPLNVIDAAVLRIKLRHLDEWTEARQANARRYAELLGLGTPKEVRAMLRQVGRCSRSAAT